MLNQLKKYLSAGQIVEVIYQDRYGKISKRPLRLQAIEGPRIKAYCLTRRAPRVFHIDNILAVFPAGRDRMSG
ncbi:WYL domain-containing protein [Brevibacillus composti]|uniref:WYL domain-containing protein n=1 Tax=Brevibacillus composti TaxID=2796470 RepID=A0A7T5JNJ1_9BACL|nr:WYL domain-containing protein [Brevibacillus composti]QQE74488.1 WYL domain-containing protein [Brevibacillus composti]QUO41570.1 WYL domain-containing protein [Brevibacillus composti]